MKTIELVHYNTYVRVYVHATLMLYQWNHTHLDQYQI